MTPFIHKISGQSVLFITTKNLDYIRNSQEIALLKKHAAFVHIIGSNSTSYAKRLIHVWSRLLFLSTKQFSTIFIGFAPQLIIPFFYFKLRGKYLIEDFFISFYDTLVHDRQKFSATSPMGHFFYWLDRTTIQKANHIICDTKTHGHYFATEFKVSLDLIEPLYLQADTSIYHPMPKPFSENYNAEKFHVLYFGSILPLQGLPVILDAIELIKDRSDIQFTIIGPISDSFKKPIGENISYVNWLSQEDLAKKISSANLCLAGHFHGTIQKAWRTIPGKAYIYEAMGKPMILGDNPATRELEHNWSVPVTYVPMGDSQALAKCISDAATQYFQ